MDALAEALIESWQRQADIVRRLALAIDEPLKMAKPSEEGWSIAFHLCHIHEVRYYWLSKASPRHAEDLPDLQPWDEERKDWIASEDLAQIREALDASARAVSEALRELLARGGVAGPYSHPVMFLQHMVWHEGWHCGLIMLAMRRAGREPTDEWEEANMWSLWRGPE